MLKSSLSLVAVMLLSSTFAQAYSGEKGNGGSAVVCYGPQGNVTSVELYDYWESKLILNTSSEADFGSSQLSVEEKIRLFSERLALVDPDRSKRYLDVGLSILNQMNEILRDDLGTTPINDDDSTINPNGNCRKELFAVQLKNPGTNDTRFMVRRDLYESPLVSNDVRAGIILHEAIYRHAIEKGATNSKNSRMYNYMVASNFRDYSTQIQDYAIRVLFPNSFKFETTWPIFLKPFNQVVQLRRFEISNDNEYKAYFDYNQPLVNKALEAYQFETAVLNFSTDEGSYGQVKSIMFSGPKTSLFATILNQRVRIKHTLPGGGVPQSFVEIGGDLTVSRAFLHSPLRIKLQSGAGRMNIECSDQVWFQDGQIFYCEKTKSFNFKFFKNSKIVTEDGRPIFFGRDEDDRVRPKVFYLKDSTPLRIQNTQIKKEFIGQIRIAEDDGVSHGKLSTPFLIPYKSGTAKVTGIYILKNQMPGTAHFNEAVQFSSVQEQGLSTVYLGQPNDFKHDVIGKFCSGRGFENLYYLDHAKATQKKIYVSGRQKFYDFSSGNTVNYNDEYIVQIDSVSCPADFDYTVPL